MLDNGVLDIKIKRVGIGEGTDLCKSSIGRLVRLAYASKIEI